MTNAQRVMMRAGAGGQIQGLHGKQILWHLVMLERGRRNKIGDRITHFFF